MAKRYWLMKSSPTTFSFDDLLRAPGKTTSWEGVRNFQARNLLRDQVKNGDEVLFYHSSTDEPAVVGTAVVVREAYPDPTAMDPKHKYFDAKAKARGTNPWVMVDVKAQKKLSRPVTREMMRAEKSLRDLMVLKRGARLSVQPVTPADFRTILRLGG